MSKYYEIASYHLISSYGGIGSIIETQEGSMLVQDLESWSYYIYDIKDKDRETIESLCIQDSRLVQRLKSVFPNLEYLLQVPFNSTSNNGYKVIDDSKLASAEYFPQWMFCTSCGLFMKYMDWNELHRAKKLKSEFKLYCPECLSNSRKRNKYVLLEQVRFIQISKSGEIRDIDWDDWFEQKTQSEQTCGKHRYKYSNALDIDNLNSIRISCTHCNASATLTGLFSPNNITDNFITVLKTSNSVYFPQIIRSLVIPYYTQQNVNVSEFDYRCRELDYMREEQSDEYDNLPIVLKKMRNVNDYIALTSIRTLNMASVLCSYSRIEPIPGGLIFRSGRSKHISKDGAKSRFLPCILLAGEGFLLDFDESFLEMHYNKIKAQEHFMAKLGDHKQKLQNFNPFGDRIPSDYMLYKYILLHSLSHILIKQMEAVSGYPAASINERIYCSENSHAGIMIYTVAGTEGSLGGIVTLVERGDLPQMLTEALEKARFCTNDPVCLSEKSVCFSCSFLPETSCEAMNMFLDRSFLIDPEYGILALLTS